MYDNFLLCKIVSTDITDEARNQRGDQLVSNVYVTFFRLRVISLQLPRNFSRNERDAFISFYSLLEMYRISTLVSHKRSTSRSSPFFFSLIPYIYIYMYNTTNGNRISWKTRSLNRRRRRDFNSTSQSGKKWSARWRRRRRSRWE